MNVKVKKLKWRKVPGNGAAFHLGMSPKDCPGQYEIYSCAGGYTWESELLNSNPKRVPTLRQAKAEAQADFERRVLGLLEAV